VIAEALEHNERGHHYAIDPFQATNWNNAGKHRISAANLSHRVTFHDEFPEQIFHRLPNLDFVFIDSSHLFDLSIVDFVVADKRLKVGGILGFHDTWMGAIRGLLRFILLNRSYEPCCVGDVEPAPMSRLQRFRNRWGLKVARLICGESDLICKRTPFEQAIGIRPSR
jgi:hypothetical protein